MKSALYCLIPLLLILALAPVGAATYSYALTGDWLGNYYAGQYWDEEIDFGHGFSSIQSVSIYWTGSVVSGTDDFYIPVTAHFVASMTEMDSELASASSPWSSQSYSFPITYFDTSSAFSANTWDFLLDGRTHLWIDYIAENDDYVYGNEPWGNLTSASIIVEGTTANAPEPSSLFAVAMGLVGFVGRFRTRASLC